jgi:hypothetical protein
MTRNDKDWNIIDMTRPIKTIPVLFLKHRKLKIEINLKKM